MFRFDSLGIWTRDVERAAGKLALDLDLEPPAPSGGTGRASLLDRGAEVSILFTSRSILGGDSPGPMAHSTIDHISLVTDDVARALQELRARGVLVHRTTEEGSSGFASGVILDPFGLPIELVQRREPSQPNRATAPGYPVFHHVSLITPDLRRTQRFYENLLGFRTLFEHVRDDGGFIFIVDAAFHPQSHNVMIEVIGPPYLEPREKKILEERGACYDHYCFVTDEVGELFRDAEGRGADARIPPHRDYGHWIAWLKDFEGNDLELMSPISREVLEFALEEVLETGEFVFDAGRSTEMRGGRFAEES